MTSHRKTFRVNSVDLIPAEWSAVSLGKGVRLSLVSSAESPAEWNAVSLGKGMHLYLVSSAESPAEWSAVSLSKGGAPLFGLIC